MPAAAEERRERDRPQRQGLHHRKHRRRHRGAGNHADLRVVADGITDGLAEFAKADRSRILQALDAALVRLGA